MSYLTFEEAQDVHKTLSEINERAYWQARRWAADSYCTRMREWGIEDFDCGSSDTSIELTERIRFFEAPLTEELRAAYAAHNVEVPAGAPFVSS